MYRSCKAERTVQFRLGALSSQKLQMSLLSQRDRQLAITAFNHYIDFLSSEVEFLEKEDMLDDPDYQEYKSELTESYALVNWVKLEYQKNEN